MSFEGLLDEHVEGSEVLLHFIYDCLIQRCVARSLEGLLDEPVACSEELLDFIHAVLSYLA